MSEFSVLTSSLTDAGARLGGISGSVNEIQAHVAGCSGAASGTPLDGAMEDLLGQWSATLPHFALAGDRLSNAVTCAATNYTGVDTAVAGAAGAGDDG
jgi:hypothetical protein